ncbi:hypothetical protein EXIGLDRAFT_841500 [Exidia glandulosa HHB12029]|uniref:DUF6533 domain-containing protein n=1 Tax=Exidia glandulosa HHB12029 TaxID=1314781 RepID=A0A165DV79_EXIGL|nr:hypothetical protein EXIGLDRAFT_841500 [Exidia glandulosa HHB12029]
MAGLGVNPALLPLLANVKQLVSDVYVVRYVTISSLALAVYDGIVLFPYEVRYIWRARNSFAKWVYLLNRYISFGGIALLVRGTGALQWGNVTDDYCRGMVGVCLVLGALAIGVANYLVLLKVWFLWDQRRMVVALTTVAWLFSYIATLAVVGASVHQLMPHTFSFAPYGLNVCGVIEKPAILRGIWAAPIALEVVVFVFTLLNAVHRPRPANLSLTRALYRDGILFFAALFFLRIFNLVATVALPASLQFIGSCLIWGVNAALLHRLILNQSPQRAPVSTTDARELDDEMIEAYDLAHAVPQLQDRLSFFDKDVFNNPPKPRRQVKWAENVKDTPRRMLMDTPEQESSLRSLWNDGWRAVGAALDRAAAHTV